MSSTSCWPSASNRTTRGTPGARRSAGPRVTRYPLRAVPANEAISRPARAALGRMVGRTIVHDEDVRVLPALTKLGDHRGKARGFVVGRNERQHAGRRVIERRPRGHAVLGLSGRRTGAGRSTRRWQRPMPCCARGARAGTPEQPDRRIASMRATGNTPLDRERQERSETSGDESERRCRLHCRRHRALQREEPKPGRDERMRHHRRRRHGIARAACGMPGNDVEPSVTESILLRQVARPILHATGDGCGRPRQNARR